MKSKTVRMTLTKYYTETYSKTCDCDVTVPVGATDQQIIEAVHEFGLLDDAEIMIADQEIEETDAQEQEVEETDDPLNPTSLTWDEEGKLVMMEEE